MEKANAKNAAANQDGEADANSGAMQSDPTFGHRREEMQAANIKMLDLLDLPPDQRLKEILKLSPEEQRIIANRTRGPKPTRCWEA